MDACHSAHYGRHPGDAQQEGKKVGGQLREQDDRLGNRGQHVLNQRADIRNWRHPGDAQQEGIKVGLQLRERDDRTGNRGQHVLNQRADIRNWPDHIGNRRHHIRNRRHRTRNRRHRVQKPRRPDSETGATATRNRRHCAAPQKPAPTATSETGATRSEPRRPDQEPRHRGPSRLSSHPWCPCRQARSSSRLFRVGGMLLAWLPARAKRAVLGVRAARLVLRLFRPSAFSRRWTADRRAQRNRWNRDRQRRPRPRHPSAGPLRARKHLQRSANATEPRSAPHIGHRPARCQSRAFAKNCRKLRPHGQRSAASYRTTRLDARGVRPIALATVLGPIVASVALSSRADGMIARGFWNGPIRSIAA